MSTASDGSSTGHTRTTDQTSGQRRDGSQGSQHAPHPGPQPQTLGDFVKKEDVTTVEDEAANDAADDQNKEQIETLSDEESVEEIENEVVEVEEDHNTGEETQGTEDMSFHTQGTEDMSFHTPPSVLHTPGPFSGTPSGPYRGPHGSYTGTPGGPYTGTPGSSRRPYFIAPPWAVFPPVEVEFEDLVKGDAIKQYTSILEISPDLDEAEGMKQTGRWGEELVYNYLLQQSESSGGDGRVTWMNEEAESGKPFDLIVDGDDFRVYVEVKATKLDQKELFEISSKEIVFAEEHKENFHLYRVYNAGSIDNVRLCRLQNLSLKMDKKEVKLCMYV